MKISFLLAWRFVRANLRKPAFQLIIIGAVIGIAALTAIGFVTSRVNQHIIGEANIQMGGDAVLTAAYPFYEDHIGRLQNANLPHSISTQFRTMAASKDGFELTRVRSVDSNYPLLGSITIKDDNGAEKTIQNGPNQGEIWIDKRLIDSLEISIGDNIEIGYAALKVSAVLERDSGLENAFYSMTPQALMSELDLAATQVIQPGSRIRYQLNIVDNENQLTDWLDNAAFPDDVEINSASDGQSTLSTTLEKAQRYFSLSNLLTVILTGITIAIAAMSFAYRELHNCALLGCLGLGRNQLRAMMLFQLAFIAIFAAILGIILGYIAHFALINIFSTLVTGTLPPPSITPVLIGFIVSLFFTLGFSAVPLLRTADTPPLSILRDNLASPSATFRLGALMGGVFIFGLLWLQTRDIRLTIIMVIGTLIALGLLMILLRLIIRIFKAEKVRPQLKPALGHLKRTPWIYALQITAFALVGATLGLTLLLNFDAINQWRGQLPDKTPNRFAFNLQQKDTVTLNNILEKYNGEKPRYYPIVRARLTQINGINVRDAVTKETANREDALQRDLSLTFTDTLPDDNELLDGQWWQPNAVFKQLSLEEEVAKNLNIGLGDTLSFTAGSQPFDAKVTSIRSVEWENFKPNFYMIFAPGDLDEFSTNWLTAFYLDEVEHIEAEIRQAIAAITLINVETMLEEARSIINKVAQAISGILLMTLCAGIVLFLTALVASTSERTRETTIMRVLGAPKDIIRNNLLVEFFIVGMLSGLLASLIILISGNLLYQRLEINAFVPAIYWIFWPVVMGLALALAGLNFANKIARQSPLDTLKNT